MSDLPTPNSSKIFVSFLGTGKYEPIHYDFGNEKISHRVKFIQTATAQYNPCDRYLIFCTQKAKETHWDNLCDEFNFHKLSNLSNLECIDIPTGQEEKELWDIFECICNQIPEGSKLVFDITHSLRCLPVLMTILFNFLKVTKNVEIEKCLYGAWEAKPEKKDVAPVFDLTPFFVLNDWSQAVYLLEKTGNASEINEIIKSERSLFQKPDNEIEISIDKLSKTTNSISNLTLNIAACRGREIQKADINSKFNAISDETVKNLFPPFATIYKRLKEDFKEYKHGELTNGLIAARWCDKYNLIPQRNTILQETIISVFEEKNKCFFEACGVSDRIEIRKIISHYLQNPQKDHELKRGLPDPKRFAEKFNALSTQRNDVNHGGFCKDPRPVKTLKNLEEDLRFFEKELDAYTPTPFGSSKAEILVGNSFPFPLIRGNVRIVTQELGDFPVSAEIHSFWGHENTLRVASDFLKVDLTPKTDRPALKLSENNRPMLDEKEFTECWIVSPNYVENFRPEIGGEVAAEQIRDWTILKIIWE